MEKKLGLVENHMSLQKWRFNGRGVSLSSESMLLALRYFGMNFLFHWHWMFNKSLKPKPHSHFNGRKVFKILHVFKID